MSLSLQNQSIQSQIQMSRDLATQPLNVDSSRMNSEGVSLISLTGTPALSFLEESL